MERVLNEEISTDCVIFGFDFERLNVLLVDRELVVNGTKYFKDLTLTGNHIYEDEDLDVAAKRILFDLIGENDIYLEQFHTFGDVNRTCRPNDILWIEHSGRNPMKRVISVGYVALLTKRNVVLEWKGRNVAWFPVNELKDLAFDHMNIVQTALKYIRHKLEVEPCIGFELLPEKFTLSQLQTMFEVVFDIKLDKRNFRRKALKMKYIIPLNEKQVGVSNKPAQLFTFDREIYNANKTLDGVSFLF
jgi:hypothetical protein